MYFYFSQDEPASILTAAKKQIKNIGIFLKVRFSCVTPCKSLLDILLATLHNKKPKDVRHYFAGQFLKTLYINWVDK